MNPFVYEYYQVASDVEDKQDSFQAVIALDSKSSLTWEEVQTMAPDLPRGWFELTKLSVEDRVEFTRGFWLKSLPYIPGVHEAISDFFSKIDDVSVFLTKDFSENPYTIEMVYSVSRSSTFFRGGIGSSKEEIEKLQDQFDHVFPKDFCSFLMIHNGFAKTTDTGILLAKDIQSAYLELQAEVFQKENPIRCSHKTIDSYSLIPFYQCFGRDFYQCFYIDWYPKNSIGNVYYSGHDMTISAIDGSIDNTLSFVSFLDWLIFYLESMEV
jgi:hypothetical protein